MSRKSAAFAVALVLSAGLAACATPTPYQPNIKGQSTAGGYSEVRLEPNRYRVNFMGNSLTSRETVEGYLLFRASELTVESGYDWFSIVDRDTDKKTRTYVEPDPFWADRVDVRTVERYEASAEIVMQKGAKPTDDVKAFDARAVIENLKPRVQYPQPK